MLLAAGTPGFGFGSGEVWAAAHRLERQPPHASPNGRPNGHAVLSGGELLLPGEITLGPGESYTTPWIYGSYGVGLDAVAARFHQFMRARPQHPRTPRPVILNTWESVYFDMDLDALIALAEAGAEVGVERYVLDDGWFVGRRDDNAGLGDWQVDPDVWPDGPAPPGRPGHRAGHAVRALGRTRDDQPGLESRPRPPRMDPGHRRPAADRVPPPAGPRPGPPRRVRLHPDQPGRAADASTGSATSSGTTTGT